jgi:hypothetical protein
MEPAKFSNELPAHAVRHEVEATDAARADLRAENKRRLRQLVDELEADQARDAARAAARQQRETDATVAWMRATADRRRTPASYAGGGGGGRQARRVHNTPTELRSMLDAARKNGHAHLALLLEQSLRRSQGEQTAILERSATPGATCSVR